MGHSANPGWLSSLVPIGIIGIVIALRWRRMGRSRPLNLKRVWILPAIYTIVVGFVFVAMPPSAQAWAWSGVALLIGGVVGWYRGRTIKVEVDPTTHALSQRASPAALLLLAGMILVRMAFRAEMASGSGPAAPALAMEVAMAFAIGVLVAYRLEITLRARRSLAEVRSRPTIR